MEKIKEFANGWKLKDLITIILVVLNIVFYAGFLKGDIENLKHDVRALKEEFTKFKDKESWRTELDAKDHGKYDAYEKRIEKIEIRLEKGK